MNNQRPCKGANIRNIVTLLTASFILLSSSFTLSSCKACDKGKKPDPPIDRGGDTTTEPALNIEETGCEQAERGGDTTTEPALNGTTSSSNINNPSYGMSPSFLLAQTMTLKQRKAKIVQVQDRAKSVSGDDGIFNQIIALAERFRDYKSVEIHTYMYNWLKMVQDAYKQRKKWLNRVGDDINNDFDGELHFVSATNSENMALCLLPYVDMEIGALRTKAQKGKASDNENNKINAFDELLKLISKADEIWDELVRDVYDVRKSSADESGDTDGEGESGEGEGEGEGESYESGTEGEGEGEGGYEG
jgi:hypothetical protein